MTDKLTQSAAIELLRGIGGKMSNVMFNLGHRARRTFTDDEAALFLGLQKEWDAAARASVEAPTSAVAEPWRPIETTLAHSAATGCPCESGRCRENDARKCCDWGKRNDSSTTKENN